MNDKYSKGRMTIEIMWPTSNSSCMRRGIVIRIKNREYIKGGVAFAGIL